MAEFPILTVALPTCNGAAHLADALRGILAQQGVTFDLLVSDDRSDDTTLEVVRQEAGDRARVVVNSERLGLAGNWNQCVAMAQTEWVAVFHQDDVMRPGHLAAHLRSITEGPPDTPNDRIGLIAGPADSIDDRGRAVPAAVVEPGEIAVPAELRANLWGIRFPPGEFVGCLAERNPLRCSAVTIRKAAHAEVGGFDPSYRYAVDWDFWVRVARSWSVQWLVRGRDESHPRPSVGFRWHPASETHRFKTGTADLDEQIRLLDDLYRVDGPRWPDAGRRRRDADRRLARAFLNRAYDGARSGNAPLARTCLRRAIALRPCILGTIARDPRLAARLAIAVVSPGAGASRSER